MKKIKQFNSAARLVVALLLLPLAAGAIVIKSVKSKPKNNITPIRVTPPGGGESQTQQIIEMLNGDSLSGSMLAYDYGSGVTWKNDAALGDIIFKSHSIARVKLQHALPPGVSPAKSSRVRLRNGDELIGELKMINSSHVSLNTWYGGHVKYTPIRRDPHHPGRFSVQCDIRRATRHDRLERELD